MAKRKEKPKHMLIKLTTTYTYINDLFYKNLKQKTFSFLVNISKPTTNQ